jgi:hypothetical protein
LGVVIYLNGPINAGKTTVAKLLTELIPRSVVIEIDELPAPSGMSLEESVKPLLSDAAMLAGEWHKRGLCPIVVWPISGQDHAEFVARVSAVGAVVRTFTLAPKLEIALSNRGTRELTEWERSRIRYHYGQGIHCPSFGMILDNSEEPARRTAERIVEGLGEMSAP